MRSPDHRQSLRAKPSRSWIITLPADMTPDNFFLRIFCPSCTRMDRSGQRVRQARIPASYSLSRSGESNLILFRKQIRLASLKTVTACRMSFTSR